MVLFVYSELTAHLFFLTSLNTNCCEKGTNMGTTKKLWLAVALLAGCAAETQTEETQGEIGATRTELLEATYVANAGMWFADGSEVKLENLLEPGEQLAVLLKDDEVVLFQKVDWHNLLLEEPGPFRLAAVNGEGTSALNAELAVTYDHEELENIEPQPMEVEVDYGCSNGYYYYKCNGCRCSGVVCNPGCIRIIAGWRQRYYCVYGTLYQVSGGYCTTSCSGWKTCSVST